MSITFPDMSVTYQNLTSDKTQNPSLLMTLLYGLLVKMDNLQQSFYIRIYENWQSVILSTVGDVQYHGGYHKYHGDILSTVEVFSTVGDIMNTMGDILSTVGVFSTMGDIMSTMGDIVSTMGDIVSTMELS